MSITLGERKQKGEGTHRLTALSQKLRGQQAVAEGEKSLRQEGMEHPAWWRDESGGQPQLNRPQGRFGEVRRRPAHHHPLRAWRR